MPLVNTIISLVTLMVLAYIFFFNIDIPNSISIRYYWFKYKKEPIRDVVRAFAQDIKNDKSFNKTFFYQYVKNNNYYFFYYSNSLISIDGYSQYFLTKAESIHILKAILY